MRLVFFSYRIFRIILILLLSFYFSQSYSQLTINTAPTPAQLVQNILISGGVNISNVTFTGNTGGATSQFGSFTNASTTYLGLTSGIVMSTGYVPHIAAPGNANGNMSDLPVTGSDADLASLAGIALNQSYDKCILEFDFVPTGNTVAFSYVFGSEEEPNWVCSQYDDVFGFFLSGPGIAGPYSNGAVNIALIPGTNYPVSVNTVNNGSIGSNTSGNNCPSYGLNYSMYYVDNLSDPFIVFGGLTTVLTATYSVTPCQTYHIKLGICDTGNGNFDSGVFLGANSFNSNAFSVITSYSNPALGNNAVEGCSQGLFSFLLPAPTASPFTINYTISGTAANGIDYTTLNNTVTIPAGQDSTSIIVDPFFDGIPEGAETVIITYTNGCILQTDTIYIADNSLLQANLTNDTTICSGQSVTITATASGGIAPYQYAWNTGAIVTNTYNVSPASTTTYTVTITDGCSQTASIDVTVTVNSVSVTASSTDANCNQSNGSVTANPTGICGSGYTYQWNTGATTQTVTNLVAGNYIVTVSCGACTATASTTIANIQGPSVNISSSTDCDCGLTDGSATTNTTGGTTPYSYQWNSVPVQATQNLQNVTSGIYTVTVTDAAGCTATTSVTIGQINGPQVAIATETDASCGATDGAATISVNSGTAPYTYAWSSVPVQTTSDLQNAAPGDYSVTVTDANGCTATTSVIIDELSGPSVTATSQNDYCDQGIGTATAAATGGNGTYTYSWSTNPPQTTATAGGLTAGTYSVIVYSGMCSDTAFVTIHNIPGPDAYIVIHPHTTTIMDGPVDLSGGSNDVIVDWQWNFGDGSSGSGQNIQHQYTNLGTYYVILTVTDNYGCTYEVMDSVVVNDIYTMYIPSTFTPNNDGLNDLFLPQGINVDTTTYTMEIYDRWGNMLFRTNKWGEGWNGTKDNLGTWRDAVIDVYVYSVTAKGDNMRLQYYIGKVVLIK